MTLPEELLSQQERCRELMVLYAEAGAAPNVNVLPAQTAIMAALADSERAVDTNDAVGMLAALARLRELE